MIGPTIWMEFDMDRIAHLFATTLLALAAVIILGPGGPSVLAQQAAKQAFALARLNRRRLTR
jgi:hypothetical protein